MAAAVRSLLRSSSSQIRPLPTLHSSKNLYSSFVPRQNKALHEAQVYDDGPNEYLGSWEKPKDPKEAQRQLAILTRDYRRKVTELRKKYIEEVAAQKAEKERLVAVKKEAQMKAAEERRKMKAVADEARSAERKIAQEKLRESLMKKKAANLEYWRKIQQRNEAKKKKVIDKIHRQSSTWIDETELEKKIMEAVVDSTPL